MTVITIYGPSEGITVDIPDTMTIAVIERYVRDIETWLN